MSAHPRPERTTQNRVIALFTDPARPDSLGAAGYRDEVITVLGGQLSTEYGRGFSAKSLRHMVRFAKVFHDSGIVATLSRQLDWSRFLELISLKDPLARKFYTAMCVQEHWSVGQAETHNLKQGKIKKLLTEKVRLI